MHACMHAYQPLLGKAGELFTCTVVTDACVQGEVQRVPIIPKVGLQKAKQMPPYDHTSIELLRPWTYGKAERPPQATPPEPFAARRCDAPLPDPAGSASIAGAALAPGGAPRSTLERDDGHGKPHAAQPGGGDAGFSTSTEYSVRTNSHSGACGTEEATLDPMAAVGREQGLHGVHFAVYCMPRVHMTSRGEGLKERAATRIAARSTCAAPACCLCQDDRPWQWYP